MKTYKTLLLLFIFIAPSAFSKDVSLSSTIDTTDIKTKKVYCLLKNYINSKPDSTYDNPYWNKQEKLTNKQFDFLAKEFQPTLYMRWCEYQILSIKNNSEYSEIKVMFYRLNDDKTPFVLAIANYIVKDENGELKLFNALPINRKKWLHQKIGYIDFYFPTYHKLNKKKAIQLNSRVLKLCDDLEIKPIPFEYYLADDFDEIQSLRGFDFYFGMGGATMPSGKAYFNKVFCSGMGESFFHEAVHIEVDPYFPNKHNWIAEGIATYLGGSRGHPLIWHIIRTNEYLQKHPEIDLNNLLELVNLDEYTTYHYVLGGLIFKEIIEKGGWKLAKEFLNSGISDYDYYSAIEKFLGVKKMDLNVYLRDKLMKEAENRTMNQ